jgi:outer membrane protein assembly factor BamB
MPVLLSRRHVLLMPALVAVGRLRAAASAHWPAFRGPNGSGVADGYPMPTRWNADPAAGGEAGIVWKTPIPGLGHSSPIIWNDRIWLATAVRNAGEAPLRLGLYGDGDAADDNGVQRWMIYCLDTATGRVVWTRTLRTGKPRAERHMKATHANTTLVTDGRHLVSFFGSEGVHCHTLEGDLLWSRELGVINVSKYGIGWGFGSSPTLFRDRILLQCDSPDDPYLVALSLSDGKELWRARRKDLCERSWATPFVHESGGRVQVVTNGWPFVVSYDFMTGKELWRLRAGGDNPIPTPIAAHGLIYVANGHGAESPLFAVHPDAAGDISLKADESRNAHIEWSVPRNGAYIVTPLVYGDLLYSATNNGVLRCYDAKTGARQYESRLGDGTSAFSASPVAGDGKIYWTSEDGDVYVVRAGRTFDLLAHNRMGESCLATPAVWRGTLFFRTRHHLVAIPAAT